MAEERRTHEIPADDSERAALARSLGWERVSDFDEMLARRRALVRSVYATLFPADEEGGGASDSLETWWEFFAFARSCDALDSLLHRWFRGDARAADTVRMLVVESDGRALLIDHVRHFVDVLPQLERVFPRIARPIETLVRVASFADRYASRSQFLAACALNRDFFYVLALLFDRSRFIHQVLVRHPEILEEVLRPENLRKRKDADARRRELAVHDGDPAESFTVWLRLYVRAEQIRIAIGHLLGFLEEDEAGAELAAVADAVITDLLRRLPGGDRILVVALGKAGGGRLTFGSDLDLLFLAHEADASASASTIRALHKRIASRDGLDPVLPFDLRLRPHGDAGPLVAGIESAVRYYLGEARTWERQALLRSRVVTGPPELASQWCENLPLFWRAAATKPGFADEIWRMRHRVARERAQSESPFHAFKTGPGGLLDVEFALQILQLASLVERPESVAADTTEGWRRLVEAGIVPRRRVEAMLEDVRHLRRVEFTLRLDSNRPDTCLPTSDRDAAALASWLGFADYARFWHEHCSRMHDVRTHVRSLLAGTVSSTALEADR
jgi:glutamate-ammonia-ligase adenylyltransferase